MKLYAFQNKKTKKFVTGTNYCYYPHRQIYDETSRPLLIHEKEVDYKLEYEIRHRNISLKSCDVVEVELSTIKKIGKKDMDKIIKGENK